MKKILIILSVFLAVCLTLGAVSAFDLNFNFTSESSSESTSDGGQVDYKDGKLNIQGLDFKIPDGYKENDTVKQVGADAGENFKGFLISADGFVKGDDYIVVKVIFGDEKMNNDSYTPPEGSAAKKIAGHDGYLGESQGGELAFDYFEDGKLVEVVGPDESVITSIIS